MEHELTIQQVATLTRLSEYTLRYYEREGMLDPVSRSSSGHRRYSSADIAWIEFLNRLRATGMPIRQMKQFAHLRRQGDRTIPARCAVLKAHEQAVREQLDALRKNLEVIETKIHHYEQLEARQHGEREGEEQVRAGIVEAGGN